jgi:hypothetical protein
VRERDAHQAPGQRRGRGHREVDPARDDDQRLADREDHRHRVLAQDVEQVVLVEEVRAGEAERDQQGDEDDQRAAAPSRRRRDAPGTPGEPGR